MMPTALENHFDPEQSEVEAIRFGDRYAFEEFVRRHSPWIRSIVFGVLGRRDVLDDVTQNVWTSVWQRAAELRDPSAWRSWLYRLARNAALDAGREISRRRRQSLPLLREAEAEHQEPLQLSNTLVAEQHELVLRAIQGLPTIYREPFVLRHLNGWNYEQIAAAMEMPVDSVETRLVRARRLLREVLKEKLPQ